MIHVAAKSITAPDLGDVHQRSLVLHGLITAMDDLTNRLGPGGQPLWACIQAALPVARALADDLERLSDAEPNGR